METYEMKEHLQACDKAFDGCRAMFKNLADRIAELMVEIGGFVWGDRKDDSIEFTLFGKPYCLRHEFNCGDKRTALQLLRKQFGSNAFTAVSSLEMDRNGNFRDVGSERWRGAIHNDAEQVFFELWSAEVAKTKPGVV